MYHYNNFHNIVLNYNKYYYEIFHIHYCKSDRIHLNFLKNILICYYILLLDLVQYMNNQFLIFLLLFDIKDF